MENISLTLKSLLLKNSYKTIDQKEFLERLKRHFGINNYDKEIIILFNQKGYEVNIEKQYLNTYPFEPEYIKKYVLQEGVNNDYNNKFIYYNKIIFNDNISAITSLIGDKESVEDIYFYFDYEKNLMLNKFALSNINYRNFELAYIQHLFLYNDKSRNPIKVEVIKHIFKNMPKEVEDYSLQIIEMYFINWQDIISEDKYKFHLIAYLLEQLLKKYENEKTTEKSVPLVKYIYTLHKSTVEIFIKENYFENKLVNYYSNTYFEKID